MKLNKLFLAIGIAVLFTFFIAYGTHVFYKPPENICSRIVLEKENSTIDEIDLERDKCWEEIRPKYDNHNKNTALIVLPFAIAALVAGIFLSKLESIGSGLLGGGVLLTLYAVMRAWNVLGEYIRLVIIGVALAVLIWFGYKKIDKKK
ncbi:MAG: hypothetical protein ABIF92_01330 [archaeon]